jgi:hypothetical protein
MNTATAAKTSARKKSTPAPVVLTPEQIEAQARREERNLAYLTARADLIGKARVLAEKLHPGRVFSYSAEEGFSVMFGTTPALSHLFRGPGVMEMNVDVSTWERLPESDEFATPTLRFAPRCYSLGSTADLAVCEELGRALIDGAAFARTITALVQK